MLDGIFLSVFLLRSSKSGCDKCKLQDNSYIDAKQASHRPTSEFVSLLTEHQADLWAYIISQMPGSPDVGDILQKNNLVLWTKQNQSKLGTNFRAWAFTIARF